MKKLTLNVEELTVDSFDLAPAGEGKGTVRAHDDTYAWSCGSICPTVTDFGRCCPP
jgi:hypothetical protein